MNFFCRYCFCTKNEIRDLKGIIFFQLDIWLFHSTVLVHIIQHCGFLLGHTEWGIQRNYDSHIENFDGCKVSKGCIWKPVMTFDAETCLPDMLHMKKVTKLINQLVDWSILQKKEEVLINEMKFHKIPFV